MSDELATQNQNPPTLRERVQSDDFHTELAKAHDFSDPDLVEVEKES